MAVAVLQRRFTRQISLDHQLRPSALPHLSQPDRLLLKELVDGVLRHLLLLDYWITVLSSRPLERIDGTVLWILRTALYQIEFLRIPDYAAVNEATGLCSPMGVGHSRGFVNAILRAFLRERPAVPSGDSVQALSVRLSHPTWLVDRLVERLGPARAESWMEENNRHPDPVVWVNPFNIGMEAFRERLEQERIAHSEIPGLPDACRVEAAGFIRHELYQTGACFFMDPDSQAVARLPETASVRRAADFCSAPGGKSFVLRSRLSPDARLCCGDLNDRRLITMRQRAERLGIAGLGYLQADIASAAPCGAVFDLVLLDVPCSGLGTLAANPEVRWFVHEADLAGFQERQLRILRSGFQAARREGLVIYSTCSSEPEENEIVIQRFLESQPDAGVEGEPFRGLGAPAGTGRYFAARIRRF